MKNLKRLNEFLRGNRNIFLFALLSIGLSSLMSSIMPIIIRIIIDSIIGTKPFALPSRMTSVIEGMGGRNFLISNLWVCGAVFVGLTAVNAIFMYLRGKLAAVASENSGKKFRERLYDHIVNLPYDYHVKSHAGDLIQRCTSDVETVMGFVSSQAIDIVQSLTTFGMALAIMLSIDAEYTLYSLILMPAVFVATILFFNGMKKTFKLTDEAEGRMTSTLQENLTGVRVVKAFGAQNYEIGKFDEKNKEYRNLILKIVRLMSNFWSSGDFICLSQMALVLLLGIYWCNTGRLTLGTMVAFTSYCGMLIWPVRQLGQLLAFMGQSFVSLGRLQEVLDAPLEKDAKDDIKPEIKGEIEFDSVTFGYDENLPIVKDLSFKIEKGQTVASLGATGSGKSSLLHLLIRLYDYQKGSIKLDGIELKNIDRRWVRKNVGIALQEPFLFSKQVRENIRFGDAEADNARIEAAAGIAAIHDSILEFDKGYETMVGERGVTLSGGQRQRLAIARAIIREVPILIFDDSLSAVDMETDAQIRTALRERSSDTTTIIVSHRITTLSEADVIFVLEDGMISQKGSHDELINQEGLYRRVWQIQGALEDEIRDAG
jgi:ATP-binding cassette, subfamily B, bacterial